MLDTADTHVLLLVSMRFENLENDEFCEGLKALQERLLLEHLAQHPEDKGTRRT